MSHRTLSHSPHSKWVLAVEVEVPCRRAIFWAGKSVRGERAGGKLLNKIFENNWNTYIKNIKYFIPKHNKPKLVRASLAPTRCLVLNVGAKLLLQLWCEEATDAKGVVFSIDMLDILCGPLPFASSFGWPWVIVDTFSGCWTADVRLWLSRPPPRGAAVGGGGGGPCWWRTWPPVEDVAPPGGMCFNIYSGMMGITTCLFFVYGWLSGRWSDNKCCALASY